MAVLLDYDGTLVDLCLRPEDAVLDGAGRELVVGWEELPRVKLALVTGRDLASLRRVAGELPGVAVAGNGGMYLRDGDWEWVHPEARARAAELEDVRRELEPAVARWPGAEIEAKTLSFTVHFRACPQARPELERACVEAVERHGGRFRLLQTKHGVEVQPDIPWDKGRGIVALLDRWQVCDTCLYAGDDVIDEAAFEAVRQRGGVTCRIAAEARETRAEWTLPSVASLRMLLRLLTDRLQRNS